ncbi:hypothetical protein Tco_0895914 [Tanacetum coccineum]|uniref:Uncharacterized protein n=1 Tax=Tanacetum coccineum TaxID=301880 RepID=A0ABQ5CI14_9ASTR
MDDLNITMKEYIKLKEAKARKRGKVFNWKTAKYGKIWYDENNHDLRSVETEFPAIAFTCEPTVSSLNDEIDFRVLIDDSDDEDYTSEKDNDNNEINIIQPSEDMALPPHDQRHQYLRYEGLQYTEADIADFELRLARISTREAESARQILDKGDLKDYWIGILSAGDFLGTAPSYTAIQDPILRLFHRLIACSIVGRSQAPKKGLTVIALALLVIDMAELVRLHICEQLDDTWAWEDVHEIHGALAEQREVISAMARDFSRFCTWTTTSLTQMMDRIKPGGKFNTIVHEYVTEPSKVFTPKSRMEKREMISNMEKLKKSLT